jgi:predicted TIM-barrel fold metal-dependent hydrolase
LLRVDVHTHVWECPGHVGPMSVEENRRVFGGSVEMHIDPDEHDRVMREGTEVAVVFGLQAAYNDVWVPNEYVAEYVARDRGRFVGFASVDPNHPRCIPDLQYAVRELGLRGVKLSPVYQNFDPGSLYHARLYREIGELGIPIMWHMGHSVYGRTPLRVSQPSMLDPVAYFLGETPMVIAHFGHPWVDDTLAMLRKHGNVYADLAGSLSRRPWDFYQVLIGATEYGVAHKVLAGTDYPVTTPARLEAAIRGVNGVLEDSSLPRVPDDVIEAICRRESLDLLGIG